MKLFLLYLKEHKGIAAVVVIVLIVFLVFSIGMAIHTQSQMQQEPTEEQPVEQTAEGEDVKLTDEQQSLIQNYDAETQEFIALLSANLWASYQGDQTLTFGSTHYEIKNPKADDIVASFAVSKLQKSEVESAEMGTLTRYVAALETNDGLQIMTMDQNSDGTYYNLSLDVKGTNNVFTRINSATSFEITEMEAQILKDFKINSDSLETALQEYCALYYPTAAKAECSNLVSADYLEHTISLGFELLTDTGDIINSVSVIYHTDSGQYEVR